MIEDRIVLLITNELTNQLSEDDNDLLKDWLEESTENVNFYHSYKEAFLNGNYDIKARNSEKVYNKLSEKLGFNDVLKQSENQTKDKPKRSIRRKFVSWIGMAAILIIVITFSWIAYFQIEDNQFLNSTAPSSELIVKSNPSGIKSLITLPDGSKVKLNSESSIEYFSDFKNGRFVKLVGEAFFEVTRDTLNPFVVKSGDLNIKVLGTSFNVQALPFEKHIKVALVSGKVEIEKHDGLEFTYLESLSPSEMMVYNHHSSKFDIEPFDSQSTLGWKNGELIFQEEGFDHVIKKLERWYGVNIHIGLDTKMSGKYNGIYKNASLEVVLEGMGFTSDFTFEIKGKDVYIN